MSNCPWSKQVSARDQVAALTTHIENGFQSNLKTGVTFLDLTAAYNNNNNNNNIVICKARKCQQQHWIGGAGSR